MRKQLLSELGRMTLISVAIFAFLFAILYAIEHFFPSLQGTLLRWSEPAFIVGIPASVFGVAYVLTIRNPKNYLGFYLGIVMSLLLAVQFYFQGNYDLVVLQTCIFTPFLILSINRWRRQTLHPSSTNDDSGVIAFLDMRSFVITTIVFLAIIALDYVLATLVLYHDHLSDNVLLKLLSGAMISTAVMANFWMIFKKNDAWLNWVLYSVVGILFYLVVNNAFSFILFLVFLIVNAQAQYVWIRQTKTENMGWTRFFTNRRKI